MGEDITAGEIGIYLLNRVEVTLKDDSRAEGILQNIAAETITVEGREIMLSDVADIRLVGELTDYDVMRDTGILHLRRKAVVMPRNWNSCGMEILRVPCPVI